MATRFNDAMLTEEALILVATLGASGFLVLGVVELVWPARPRRGGQRAREAPAAAIVARRLEAAKSLAAPFEGAFEPVETRDAAAAPDVAPLAHGASTETVVAAAEQPAPSVTVAAPPVVDAASPRPIAPIAAPRTSGETRPQVLPIDTCRTMYENGRYAEVVSLGSAALEVHAGLAAVSHRPYEAAALLDLVGLSKHALGDHAGGRAALEAAILGADPAARSSHVRHLVAAVRALADPATAWPDESARERELRACLDALDRALTAAPADEDAIAARAEVREALSMASEEVTADVGGGGADHDAREAVATAIADAETPTAWRERQRDELAAASSAEIGQLTAQAIRSVQEGKDAEALEALERAERLTEALPSDAVTDERREEFERRLWWGYSKVGLRRIETESFEHALEPLFRALRFGGSDEDRAVETRGALVRALEGAVDAAAHEIVRLSGTDPSAARRETERLSEILRKAGERGVAASELADVAATLRDVQARVTPGATP